MTIIELARYRLIPAADSQALADAERAIQNEVGPGHPGYLGRELLLAADGSYVLIMRWASEQAASTWNATLFASAAGQKLLALVDRSSMTLERLTSALN